MGRKKSRKEQAGRQRSWPLWAGFGGVAAFFLIWLCVSWVGQFLGSQSEALQRRDASSKRQQDLAKAADAFIKKAQVERMGLLSLPVVEGWTRGELTVGKLEEDDWQCDYRSEAGAVSFFQFRRGQEFVADDLNSVLVDRELQIVRDGFNTLIQQGIMSRAVEGPDEVIDLGGLPLKCRRQEYVLVRDNGAEQLYVVHVWPFENRMLKIVYTGKMNPDANTMALLDRLYAEFARACLEQTASLQETLGTGADIEEAPAD